MFLNHKDATITKQVVDVGNTVSDTMAVPSSKGEGVAHGGRILTTVVRNGVILPKAVVQYFFQRKC